MNVATRRADRGPDVSRPERPGDDQRDDYRYVEGPMTSRRLRACLEPRAASSRVVDRASGLATGEDLPIQLPIYCG